MARRSWQLEVRLANALPQFGGTYRTDSTVVVYLTDSIASERTREIAMAVLRPYGFNRPVRFVHARFTYKQLVGWMFCVQSVEFYDGTFAYPYRENKVWIDAKTEKALKKVKKTIDRFGYPRAAFRLTWGKFGPVSVH